MGVGYGKEPYSKGQGTERLITTDIVFWALTAYPSSFTINAGLLYIAFINVG